jgi:hypothetical protein
MAEFYVGKHMSLVDAESVYDKMYAEFFGDRKKTRRKPDNRTREKRIADWNAEKDRRKDIHLDWVDRDSRRRYGHGKTHYWDSNAERKIYFAEFVARADWELEQRDIEVARIDAEIMAEYADWEARMEWESMCRKLNEWLKYA